MRLALSTYSAHERAEGPGGRDFGPDHAKFYARRFGVSPEWLLTGRVQGPRDEFPDMPAVSEVEEPKAPIVGFVGPLYARPVGFGDFQPRIPARPSHEPPPPTADERLARGSRTAVVIVSGDGWPTGPAPEGYYLIISLDGVRFRGIAGIDQRRGHGNSVENDPTRTFEGGAETTGPAAASRSPQGSSRCSFIRNAFELRYV